MRTALAVLLAAVLLASWAPAAEVPREKILARIEEGVEVILKGRQEDGRFEFNQGSPVGETALGLLALEYARPYLAGGIRDRAREAGDKAASYIIRQSPEMTTYSAGVVLTSLGRRDVDRKRLLLYATMLATSQHDKDPLLGMWGYRLKAPPGGPPAEELDDWGDNSNSQFAVLGLYMASRKGFAAPRTVWERAAEHFTRAQDKAGGWTYGVRREPGSRVPPTANMTIAGAVSLALCEEMLQGASHAQCEPRPRSKAVDAGLQWIADHWEQQKIGTDAYGLYGLERLGILVGRSNIGAHDWYREGAQAVVTKQAFNKSWGSPEINWCFAVAFLAHGLDPVVINKLERRGADDWNCDPWDARNLVDYVQDHYQQSVQWRIVTLEAPLEQLLRTPILYVTGHEKLDFSVDEKAKLKAYVEGGGTILGEACCSKGAFADSFRARMRETFGEGLRPLPAEHRLFEALRMKDSPARPAVECLPIAAEEGRPGVLFLPADLSCRWTVGGPDARGAFEVGSRLYLYITKDCRQMYLKAHPVSAP